MTTNKKVSVKTCRIGELFCGPGGFGHAADMAATGKIYNGTKYKIEHLWANDVDPNACATYAENFKKISPNLKVIPGDIKNVDFDELKNQGDINGLTFGFPCNDFSIVGKQKGLDGHFGPLYKYGIEALETFAPDWFIAENVGGIRSANDGEALFKILRELESTRKVKYKITPHYYKFEEYGVPQKRHRVIIVGINSEIGKTFKVPAPTIRSADNYMKVRDALRGIPGDAENHERTRQSKKVEERLKIILPGNNIWETELPEYLQLKVKGARLSQIYRRLHPEQPAYTITGSGGGGTHVYHHEEFRALTNRERARLQTFDDTFVFKGSKESVRKQIGMAVPPRGVQKIIEAVFMTIEGVEYDSVAPYFDLSDGEE